MSNTNFNQEIQNANSYKEAIDELHSSINSLTFSMPSFSAGMKAGLSAVAEKMPAVIDSLSKINEQNKQLAANGQKPQNVLKQLASSFLSWNSLISVGITLLATYSDVIIDWVADMLKGKTTFNDLTKSMRDNNTIANVLLNTKIQGQQAAQNELVALNSLYRATQGNNLLLNDKKKVIAILKDQWPATFRNLTDEAIITGKAAAQYQTLTRQIYAAAEAEAYKSRMVDNLKRKVDNDFKIEAERAKNLKLIAQENALSNQEHKAAGHLGNAWMGELKQLQEQRKASDKIIYDLTSDTVMLNKQNDKLTTGIDKLNAAHGASVLIGQKVVEHKQHKVNTTKQEIIFDDERLEQIAKLTEDTLSSYVQQIEAANSYFEALKAKYRTSKADVERIDKEKAAALKKIADKFRQEDLASLTRYETELKQLKLDNIEDAKARELAQFEQDIKEKRELQDKQYKELKTRIEAHIKKKEDLDEAKNYEESAALQTTIDNEKMLLEKMGEWKVQFEIRNKQRLNELDKPTTSNTEEPGAAKNTDANGPQGNNIGALNQQLQLLAAQHTAAVNAARQRGQATTQIEEEYANKKAEIEERLTYAKVHAGDKYIDAVLRNTKKDSAIFKAAFVAKKATAIADVIISTKKSLIASFEGYAGLPFIGQALAIAQGAFIAAQGAASISQIAKQKPGFASGGHFVSDGRGALLPGYSRTDNTNAYLRSGEAVVVSEAMRNPWARNLVSAINVAHGGRDFSVPVNSRAYATGGIFTDGGNAGRYYSQPVNDVKDLANTLAYQMINNFPPVYVDVKDINTQQSILAKTVDRVNL